MSPCGSGLDGCAQLAEKGPGPVSASSSQGVGALPPLPSLFSRDSSVTRGRGNTGGMSTWTFTPCPRLPGLFLSPCLLFTRSEPSRVTSTF